MAKNDEITLDQSFTERTLKYGRNLMVVAVPIFVFAWVPLVDLATSRPLNFAIQEGGEIWIWRILLALLVYYGFRFFGLAIPDFLKWRTLHGVVRADIKSRLKAYGHNLAAARQTHDEGSDHLRSAQKDVRQTRSELRHYNWRRTYFWFADAGLPTVLFGLALWASLDQIFMLHCLEIPLNCAGGETP